MELGSDESEGNEFARPHSAWAMKRIARTPVAEEMVLVGLGSFLLVTGVFFAYVWRTWRRMERDSDLEPL